jgi:hypothetical protein
MKRILSILSIALLPSSLFADVDFTNNSEYEALVRIKYQVVVDYFYGPTEYKDFNIPPGETFLTKKR